MKEDDAKKIAEALAKALKAAGIDGEVMVGKGDPDSDRGLKNLASMFGGGDPDFSKPCESAMHEAYAIAVMNGFPPNTSKVVRDSLTWTTARRIPHKIDAGQLGASMGSPEWWQSLGKGLGWKEDTSGIGMAEYMIHWHEFINHLNNGEGKRTAEYTDEFFEPFILDYQERQKKAAEDRGS